MKKRRLLIPLIGLALLLTGCKTTSSEEKPVSSEQPPVTSVTTEQPPVSSEEPPASSEETPVANIKFGADPFNGTSATGVAGVGVALYYDATEDDVAVAFDKVAFTVNKPSGVLFDPVIGLVEKLSVYYLRPMEPGTYTVTLTVEDSAGLKATATKEIVVSTGDLSGDVDAIKAAIAAIYPDNIYTNLD